MRSRSDSRAAQKPEPPATPAPSPAFALAPPSTAPQPGHYVNAYLSGNAVVTVRRDAGGGIVRGEVPAEWCCFLALEQVTDELERTLRASKYVRGTRREGRWLRVSWTDREVLRRAASRDGWFESRRIKVYEADVDPVRRWQTDAAINIARPRRAYVDLETDSRVPFSSKSQARILCWSLVSEDGETRTAQLLAEDSDDAERLMLRALWQQLEHFDQVVAWNGDRFDFPMILDRSAHLGMPVDDRRLLWLDHLVLYRRMNASASESGEEKQSLALGAVARAVLGEERSKLVKLGEVGGETSWGMWEAGGEARERLRLYCLDDSDLMRAIEAKTGYLELHFACCEATYTFPDTRGINPTQQVEGFLLRLGKDPARDMHFPTHHFAAEGEESSPYKGAFVMEPTRRGILKDVHVADFSRLYPSILISWNMSLETWRPGVRLVESAEARPSYLSHLPLKRFPLPEGCCAAARTDQVFANEPEGILPAALREMLRLRKHWDEVKKGCPPDSEEWQQAARRSAAYKIAANSFYGVIGSPFSRFFERAVAESIAQGSVFLIEETIRATTAKGWRPFYGDTDSTFTVGCTRAEFSAFVAWCNAELYPRLLKEKGCTRNAIELAYEKGFRRLIMIGKKRYAGRVSHYKGSDAQGVKLEIKGLEYKRGDTNRLAREFQKEAIDLLLIEEREDAEPFLALVQRWRDRVLFGELAREDVVLSKRMSKPIREYVTKPKADGTMAAAPAHVEVAKILKKRGRDVGSGVRIEYVVVDGDRSPIVCAPAEDWDTLARGPASMEPVIILDDAAPGPVTLDRFYLWEQLIYPPTMRVLECCFPAERWGSFEKVRPAKVRGRAAREPELKGLDLGPRPKTPQKASQGAGKGRPAKLAREPGDDGEELGEFVRAPIPRADISGQRKLFDA